MDLSDTINELSSHLQGLVVHLGITPGPLGLMSVPTISRTEPLPVSSCTVVKIPKRSSVSSPPLVLGNYTFHFMNTLEFPFVQVKDFTITEVTITTGAAESRPGSPAIMKATSPAPRSGSGS